MVVSKGNQNKTSTLS